MEGIQGPGQWEGREQESGEAVLRGLGKEMDEKGARALAMRVEDIIIEVGDVISAWRSAFPV
jgi:hypothetical protein